MFDLMGAIRRRQQIRPSRPADFAETAETEQPQARERDGRLPKAADFSGREMSSATIYNHPHAPRHINSLKKRGSDDFSANPPNPQPPMAGHTQDPDAVLRELARPLKADPPLLRALLSEDDMQAIADGEYSRDHLLAYFRLMRSDGLPLANDNATAVRAPESTNAPTSQARSWEAAHDAMINHLMACRTCYAPRGRYCPDGERLCHDYLAAYHQSVAPPPQALDVALPCSTD